MATASAFLDHPGAIGRVVRPREGQSQGWRLEKCPSRAELVKIEATKCRFCGADLPALE